MHVCEYMVCFFKHLAAQCGVQYILFSNEMRVKVGCMSSHTTGNWTGDLHYVWTVFFSHIVIICQMSAYLLILSPCYFHVFSVICLCISFSSEDTQEEGEGF